MSNNQFNPSNGNVQVVDQQSLTQFQNSGINVGSVSIEAERAIAEARGQMQMAKMFPRNIQQSYAELMDTCKLPGFASVAIYSRPQGGTLITGPSIRLAEEIARCYGHMEFGHRELSRSAGKSEIEVFAWDKEKNNRSSRQITVLHSIDTKNGPKQCRDQSEIDNKIANVASKQMRSRILALVPKWFIEEAVAVCRATLAGAGSDIPVSQRVRKMVGAFASFGVNVKMIEEWIGCSLDNVTTDQIADMIGVYNSIKDGHVKASEVFNKEEEKQETITAVVADKAKAKFGSKGFNPGKKDEKPAPVEQAAQPVEETKPAAPAASQTDDDLPPDFDDF